jgi:hypothetical protein
MCVRPYALVAPINALVSFFTATSAAAYTHASYVLKHGLTGVACSVCASQGTGAVTAFIIFFMLQQTMALCIILQQTMALCIILQQTMALCIILQQTVASMQQTMALCSSTVP